MKPHVLNNLLDKVSRLPASGREGAVTGVYTFILPSRILIFRWRGSIDLPRCNERFVLILNLTGNGTVGVEDIVFTLLPGQALLVFPYQRRDLTGLGKRGGMGMAIMFETANQTALAAFRNTPVSLSARALMLAGWICDLYPLPWKTESPETNRVTMFVMFLLMELVTDARRVAEVGRRRRRAVGLPVPDELFRKIEHYLMWHMHEPIPIRILSREVGISASHLRAIFRKQVGTSMGRFIRQRKVQHAAHLLKTTSLTIKEITSNCGFRSIYTFSRCFHHEMGVPPSGYRRRKLRRMKARI